MTSLKMKSRRTLKASAHVPEADAVSFVVTGIPKAQPRARVVRPVSMRGRSVSFTPDADGTLALWRQKIQLRAREALGGRRFTGPVHLSVLFVLPCPQDCRQSRWCTTKPDLDNLVKAVKDALTEMGAWTDDAQVVSCQLTKVQLPTARATGALIDIHRFGPDNLDVFTDFLPPEFQPQPAGRAS